MTFLAWLFLGVLGSLGQQLAAGASPFAPDLLCVGTVVILTKASSRVVAAALVGFVLGFRAGTLEPLSCALLGGGLAALVLLSLREFLFTDRLPVSVLMTGVAFACVHLARSAGVALGAAPAVRPAGLGWTLLATLAAAPLALGLWDAARRRVPARRAALALSAEPRIPHQVVE